MDERNWQLYAALMYTVWMKVDYAGIAVAAVLDETKLVADEVKYDC